VRLEFRAEAIVAWRAWKIVEDEGGVALSSIIYEAIWPYRRALVSGCKGGGCLAARWPMLEHSCGIHAVKSAAEAVRFPLSWEGLRFSAPQVSEEYVIGKVSLWGQVTEHERGFRAERAYPYELVLAPSQARLAPLLASAYAVDVMVDRAYRLGASTG
jgi:hypothetical protein